MWKNGHSVIMRTLGALTLVVMIAGQVLPYSETCFGLEIVEVVDMDDSERDLDPDEKKEKMQAHELKLRSELISAAAVDFLFHQEFPSPPSLDIIIPPPEKG